MPAPHPHYYLPSPRQEPIPNVPTAAFISRSFLRPESQISHLPITLLCTFHVILPSVYMVAVKILALPLMDRTTS
jgi:hypothetical protein